VNNRVQQVSGAQVDIFKALFKASADRIIITIQFFPLTTCLYISCHNGAVFISFGHAQ
jgi:hypothetical protein